MNQGRKKNGINKLCIQCGDSFYIHESRSNVKKFCSIKCNNDYKRKNIYDDLKKTKKCSTCNEWKKFDGFASRRKGTELLEKPLLQSDCRSCSKLKDLEFKKNNKKKLAQQKNKRYWLNREKILSAKKNMSAENRERKNKRQREYAKLNKEKIYLLNRIRRHRERAAGKLPSRHDIGWLICAQDARCVYCNVLFDGNKYHIDHKIPVSRGGLNDIKNIQLLCPRCNMKKSAKNHEEYIQTIFSIDIEEFVEMKRKEWGLRNL